MLDHSEISEHMVLSDLSLFYDQDFCLKIYSQTQKKVFHKSEGKMPKKNEDDLAES